MDAERARKVEALYDSALKLESGRRAAFLGENCGGDESLRLEVESLLQHDEDAGRFLAVPALEMLAEKARLTAGERVSHYEIQGKLGEGGMGVVYKARDARLGRRVALKFVKAQFSERWEREARAIAALNHPHIATLYDVGQHEGAPYLVEVKQ
jgi:serine/threonine protein kinase